jgi:O-antigen/teichoic acid export membrane protein
MLNKAKQLLARRPGAYLGSSAALTGWLLLRAGSQALMTFAMARTLGPSDYGYFIAIIAVASFFTPLAGFGLHGVILIRGARMPEHLPQLIGATLSLWAGSALLFSLCGIAVVLITFPQSTLATAVALLVLAEIVCPSLAELIARIEQSQQMSQRFGAILSGLALARLLAALCFILMTDADLAMWMMFYAIASLVFCAATLFWLFNTRQIRRPQQAQWNLLKEGLPFGIGALSMRLQGEFNKPVLAQISFAMTGNLNIAQRAIDLVTIPLIALQEILWPRFYASPDPLNRMRPALIGILCAAIGLGALLCFVAPVLPFVLGQGYAESSNLLVWLAWLPSIQVLRNFTNALVVANGHQHKLTGLYILSATVGVGLNLWLIPKYAALGAIASSYLSEAATLLMLFILLVSNPRQCRI